MQNSALTILALELKNERLGRRLLQSLEAEASAVNEIKALKAEVDRLTPLAAPFTFRWSGEVTTAQAGRIFAFLQNFNDSLYEMREEMEFYQTGSMKATLLSLTFKTTDKPLAAAFKLTFGGSAL